MIFSWLIVALILGGTLLLGYYRLQLRKELSRLRVQAQIVERGRR
jgi:hypothetical protein